MDGEAIKPVSAKVFKCPSCGGGIVLRGMGQTLVAACGSCGAIIDVTDENYRILHEAQKHTASPFIPLGTRGNILGEKFDVIGFMQRSDETGYYFWSEYLLFNPYKGFRWLIEDQGHWTIYTMTKTKPVISSEFSGHLSAEMDGKHYRLFQTGQAVVRYVLGEFYWRVKIKDSVDVADYIAPPSILSAEKDQYESIWSHGEYLEPDVVKLAFALKAPMPPKQGVALNQPMGMAEDYSQIISATFVFVALLFVIHIATAFRSQNKQVLSEEFSFGTFPPYATNFVRKLNLEGGTSNVVISSNGRVENDWLYLHYNLVNDETNETFAVGTELSYYHGYDSDGSWAEGTNQTEVYLSSVPDGSYSLEIEPEHQSSSGSANLKPFVVSIYRDRVSGTNLFAALAALLLFPLLLWIRKLTFESRRWSESNIGGHMNLSSSDD